MSAYQFQLITARYTNALVWAVKLPIDQRRQGKDVPYIFHVIAVSALVWEDGGSENQALAALLHDAIEDAGQNHASITLRFGVEVADFVLDCIDPGKNRDPDFHRSWLGCKQAFIATLEHKPQC
jgi:(p)ppGpp synthase/HD superfamily hydrolase